MVTETTKKFRDAISYCLLAAAALYFISGLSLLFKSADATGGATFADKAALYGHVFLSPVVVVSLVGAVLVAVMAEASKNARTIVLAALGLAGINFLLGLICWLAGFGSDIGTASGSSLGLVFGVEGVQGAGKIVGIFLGLGSLLFLGAAGFYVYTVLQGLPATAPAAAPAGQWGGQSAGWGQSGYGQEAGYSQQGWATSQDPGYGQPPAGAAEGWGDPHQGQSAAAWGQPVEQSGQQAWGQPAEQAWGQQVEQQSWGQPAGQQGEPAWGRPAEASTWGQPTEQPSWGQPADQPGQPHQPTWAQTADQGEPSGPGWGAPEQPPAGGAVEEPADDSAELSDRQEDMENPEQGGWWQQPPQ
ncbi:MAG: hypothetical protein ACRDPG_03695 [Nocardioidaceae bacterium]